MTEVLNGRYQLGDVVGSGGNGAVYRATDLKLGRPVAIKVLRAGPLADDLARARMRNEARLAASIHHPGIAEVYDYEEDGSPHEGLAFIAMQLVEGWPLSQLIRAEGPMPADQVTSVIVQVAEALQVAHEAGIVHRDLKPANIMLTPAGRTVLVDFGIARTATSEPLTDTGVLLGTADYLSPEQAAGGPATAQSDLYALGVVAYHCLTGISPFHRESHVATAVAHLRDDLPPLGPEVPGPVRDLLASLTAKDPRDRPASAAQVAAAAAAAGPSSGIHLPADMPPQAASASAPTTAAAHDRTIGHTRRRGPRVVYAGITIAAVLATLFGISETRGSDPVVPDVVGMSVSDASDSIRQSRLTPRSTVVDVAGKSKGDVLRQSPAAGSTQSPDAVVRLTVASGKVRVSAKDILGRTYARAANALEKLGFVVERTDVTRATDPGEVVALDKSGRLLDGSTITLSVAVVPAQTATVPRTTSSTTSSGTSRKSTGTTTGKSNAKANGKGKRKSKGRAR